MKSNMHQVIGLSGTGKTYNLISQIDDCAKNNKHVAAIFPNQDSLVACKQILKQRSMKASNLYTIQEICADILKSNNALRNTGRIPRILTHFEEYFLFEDLISTYKNSKAVKHAVYAYIRNPAQYTSASNLESLEERIIEDLKRWLIQHEAMLVNELPYFTKIYLQSSACTYNRFSNTELFIDDYHVLSNEYQKVIELLHAKSKTIMYDAISLQSKVKVQDKNTTLLNRTKRCPQKTCMAANSLLQTVDNAHTMHLSFSKNDPEGDITVVCWENLQKEFSGVANYIKKRIEDDTNPLLPSDILVLCPNVIWGNALKKMLNKYSINVSTKFSKNVLSGNPRDTKKSLAFKTYTAIALAARPKDLVSWRAWIGYDDPRLMSKSWHSVLEYTNENNCEIVDTLNYLAQNVKNLSDDLKRLVKKYNEGKKLINTCRKRTGFALVGALSFDDREFSKQILKLTETIEGTESVFDLFEKIHNKVLDKPLLNKQTEVRIALPKYINSQEAKLVICVGMVEGLEPDKDKSVLRKLLYKATTSSSLELVLSFFRKEDLQIAESLHMKVRKTRTEQEISKAILNPSPYIYDLGPVIPGEDSKLD